MRVLIFLLLFISSVFASIGKVSAVVGDATIERANEKLTVTLGLNLEEKDIISTKSNAKVQLIFKDNTIVTLGKNSALNIQEYLYDVNQPKASKTNFNFFKGAFKTITGNIGKINKEKFKLQTKSAAIGIRGTIVLGNQKIIACTQGAITVTSAGQSVNVNANQLTRTQLNKSPSQPKNISNNDIKELENSLEPEEEKEETKSKEKKKESAKKNKKDKKKVAKKKQKKEKTAKKNSKKQKTSKNNKKQKVAKKNSSNNPTASSPPISNAIPDIDNTTNESEPFESGTVTVNSITSDDVVSVSEGQSNVTVSGTASGGDIVSGDTVTFKVNGTTYSTTVGSSGAWSVSVAGSDLRADDDFKVYVTSASSSGEVGESTITSTHTNTQSGKFLGVYYEADSDTDNFLHEDTTFEATKSDDTLTYNDTIEDTLDSENFVINGSVPSSTAFTTPAVGAYTGSSEIGTFTQNYTLDDGTTKTSTFKVQADNTGEFFVAYSDSSDTSVSGLNEMFVVGTDLVSSNMNSSKVYMYKTYKTLNIDKDSTGKLKNTSKFSTDVGYQYYNHGLNSLTHVNKDVFEKGAESFIAGTSTTMTFYDNEYTYSASSTALDTYDNYFTTTSNGVIELKGTEGQGLIASMDSTKYQYSSSGTISEKEEMLNASFLQTDKTYSVTNSGTSSLVGLVSYLAVSDSAVPIGFNAQSGADDIISFDINKATGEISSGKINQDGTNPTDYAALEFAGTLAASSAYYVSEDIFGALGTVSSNSFYKVGGVKKLLTDATQSYLIAVPDGGYDSSNNFVMFDSNDNPMMSDDDSSWGYWSADVDGNNDYHINPLSTWVAGIETSSSTIDALLNATNATEYHFNGKVIGFVKIVSGSDVTAIENINMDDTTNKVFMNFDLGGGVNNLVTTGANKSYMKFASTSSTWNLDMTSTSVSNSGFSGTMSGTGQSGSFNGNFYGDGSLKSVGGNFETLNDSAHRAYGVFKATKTQ